ncbi:MAG: FAD:protein FMN transferase [Verrucomicrobiota bacterium]|nr:FAD:protein FMN transferase [Verrucomicrobiota bacterium]MDI9383684.1 FAD:protein FMN transferase [Verrucomicrobiota bacterium]
MATRPGMRRQHSFRLPCRIASQRFWGWSAFTLLTLLTGIAVWQTGKADHWITFTESPDGIMGTSCTLVAVVQGTAANTAQRIAMESADQALRQVQARMSSYIGDSELSRFNRAGAGSVPLSDWTLTVVDHARRFYDWTDGAFDITCRPCIELWRWSDGMTTPPTAREIQAAREESSWDLIRREGATIVKLTDNVRFDLGGIAKGFAIDQAIHAMHSSGALGGLVDVGGDLRCFGQPPDGKAWVVELRHPAGDQTPLTSLRLPHGWAVCTSGDYHRYSTIGGRRYSHIIDPRTGWPATKARSVTVLAPSALEADGWATALSVLGPEGIARIPAGEPVHGLLISGTDPPTITTFGAIRQYLLEDLPAIEARLTTPAPPAD